MEKRQCSECNEFIPADQFGWTTDRYGNPWLKVCWGCHSTVQARNMAWEFDAADAGESLEEDY
jgi:hypothetical protein